MDSQSLEFKRSLNPIAMMGEKFRIIPVFRILRPTSILQIIAFLIYFQFIKRYLTFKLGMFNIFETYSKF